MKDVDGVADLRKDGKIERGGDDLLARSGGGEQLAAGTEDARRAAEHGLARRAAGVAGGEEELVFDGARRCERFPMIPPRGGPLRGQEQQLDALKRQRAEKLGEAEVVADEQAAFVPVERKGREVIAGGVVKVVMNYILVGNPEINIHGAPISTLCCYLTICVLNLFFVWKYSPQKPRYIQLFVKPVFASAVMGAAAWAVYGLVARVLSGHSAYGANALATFCGILAGVVVYGVLVITLRILRAEDVKALPKGEKIAKLLRLK